MKKILFLAANPKGSARLRLDEELREIETGLQLALNRDRFILESKGAVRPIDVRRAILSFVPQIVHFSGHGVENEGLVFEDDAGREKFVDVEGLAQLFRVFANQVECVVLNACYSKVQALAIAQHINYVIGMNRQIGDRAAIEFSVAFYDALAAGKSVEFAYNYGCAAIRLAGIPEELTPILIKKPNLTEVATQSDTPKEQPSVTKEIDPPATQQMQPTSNTFNNISGCTITNFTSSGDINYNESPK
ncbi:CHAT domain-containing protein [Scytonema hofmannii FACHB-248]|uniref:CHAT domain-containing protein n=1 Tax=Scytonema hofmannii FACHB-248 TaxID=1842502 RepID=A0ABR8GQH9_9CYAN|nr:MULTISPECIES: CHAT domain-containing protein [Nostocales]MBD2605702.1 CHAT domain-containing protein [Scytonema hofmannii FACHB-248]